MKAALLPQALKLEDTQHPGCVEDGQGLVLSLLAPERAASAPR